MDELKLALAKRYPLESAAHEYIRTTGLDICRRHVEGGFGDHNALQRLASDSDAQFWQQLSEVLVAEELRRVPLAFSHQGEGPDFLLEQDGRRVWVEVICPEPVGLSDDWLRVVPGQAFAVPSEAMLLRWTAAIKEKSEKLLGRNDGRSLGYLTKGIVLQSDAYVIAINGRMLRKDGFPELNGISQYPLAVEAAFAIGPYAVKFERGSRQPIGACHTHRPLVSKPSGSDVPADTFLDPRFAPVSAIWAVDIDERGLFGEDSPMAVVHNPLARNPLPLGLLPARHEYVASLVEDGYGVHVLSGSGQGRIA